MTPPTGPVFFGRLAAARLKWCGKSAPRLWQQRRHGKPHREQDQIGTARDVFRIAVRVGRVRCVATHIPEEWSSSHFGDGQNPAYRLSDIFLFCPHLCATRASPLANIFPVRPISKSSSGAFVGRTPAKRAAELRHAGEESLSQGALPFGARIRDQLFPRPGRRVRPSPFRSSLFSSLPRNARAPDRAVAWAPPVRPMRL